MSGTASIHHSSCKWHSGQAAIYSVLVAKQEAKASTRSSGQHRIVLRASQTAPAETVLAVESRRRTCATCFQTKLHSEFFREPIEPFGFKRQCRACDLGLRADPGDLIRNAASAERVRRLLADYEATSAQARFQNTMAKLEDCAASTHDAAAVEVAHRCHDPEFLEQRMLGIQSLLGLSRGDTIQLIRRQQDLLLLAPDLLARRLVELKLTVPKADVGQLVQLGPWLLLLDDIEGQLKPALRQIQSLMPAFDVEAKLHEGSGVWWSAADTMSSKGRRIKYT